MTPRLNFSRIIVFKKIPRLYKTYAAGEQDKMNLRAALIIHKAGLVVKLSVNSTKVVKPWNTGSSVKIHKPVFLFVF